MKKATKPRRTASAPRVRRTSPVSCSRVARSRRDDRGFAVCTILVPTDFSPPSLKALEYACALGKAFGATLHLLHVNDIAVEVPTLAPLFSPGREMQRKFLRRLEGIAAKASPPTRGLHSHVRTGKAFNEVCAAARELGADLIILATHGYRGITRAMLGSTTERIVQHAPCPVLVVREHERGFVAPPRLKGRDIGRQLRLNQILVPTDFSEHSQCALLYALAFAKHFGAKLTVLNAVYPQYFVSNAEYLPYDYGSLLDQTHLAAKKAMDKLTRATSFGGVPFKACIMEGHPVQTILDAAAENGADLIVTSTHGRTGLGHVLIGSIAEQVVRYAKCPVLVVPRSAGPNRNGGSKL